MFFFLNDPATPEIYTLSLHDALPISYPRTRVARRRAPRLWRGRAPVAHPRPRGRGPRARGRPCDQDRKSTRLNSSHQIISYAVFCLKKKKKKKKKNTSTRTTKKRKIT